MTARLGIDLGGTKISGIVLPGVAAAGRSDGPLEKLRVPTPRHDYPATLTAITGLVAELERRAGIAPGTASVGIGTPGNLRAARGPAQMKNCNSTWLNDRPLLADLEAALGPRVRIANDADCFALSEAADGAAADAASVFGIILGTGVGGGLVVRGELLQGGNGLCGEWGHMPLPYLRQWPFTVNPGPADVERIQLESALPDRRCYCGRLNCVETYLSGPGLQATHAALWNEALPSEAIVRGDGAQAAGTLDLYRHMLARSLAQVVNVVDPAVLVLGGGVSNAAGMAGALEVLIPLYAFSSPGAAGDVKVTVRSARWGDDSGVRGAARLWQAS
jgi:fructokinase